MIVVFFIAAFPFLRKSEDAYSALIWTQRSAQKLSKPVNHLRQLQIHMHDHKTYPVFINWKWNYHRQIINIKEQSIALQKQTVTPVDLSSVAELSMPFYKHSYNLVNYNKTKQMIIFIL